VTEGRRRPGFAATGLLALVLFLVGAFALGGDQPGPADSVESVRHYIASNWNAIHVHHTLIGLSYVAALWFVVMLFGRLYDAEGRPGTFSVLALSGAALAIAVEWAVIAVHSATFVDASNTVQLRSMLTAVVRELVVLELFPWATFFGAVAVVSIRGRALPGWLGWSAAVLALLDLSVGLYSGLAGVNASTPGAPFGPALILVYVPFLWFAAAGLVLTRRQLRG
jgi:hypothetical protein